MQIVLNPFTGELDLVGSSGGGGSGTLKDIQEDGIAVVANATALNFLEPDAILVTPNGSVADVDMTQYLLRAGRPGSDNDALMSTTISGTFTGSATSGFGLNLNANTETTLNFNDVIRLASNVTTIPGVTFGPTDAFPTIMRFAQDLTLDASSSPPILVFTDLGGATQPTPVWTISGTNGFYPGLLAFAGDSFNVIIQSEIGATQGLVGLETLVFNQPIFVARGPGCTAGDFDSGICTTVTNVKFIADTNSDATATLTVGQVRSGIHRVSAEGPTTINANIGWEHQGVDNNNQGAVSVVNDIGFYCPHIFDTPVSGIFASLLSEISARELRHAGAGIFGAAAGASSVATALEVQSTTQALLLSRLTTTQRDAVSSPLDGLLLFNSDLTMFQGYASGAWESLVPVVDAPAALTGQTGDIVDTAFANTPSPGFYRVSVYLVDTAADAAAGTVTAHVKFTDASGAQDVAVGPILLTTLGSMAQSEVVVSLASGSITYGTVHTGIFATAAYDLIVACERIA